MAKQHIYTYKTSKAKSKIVTALRKRNRESTVADLVAGTGLPNYQVAETLKIMLDEYRGHLKVSESGEVLYYFPQGFRNRKKGLVPGIKRASANAIRAIGTVLTAAFKIWIMVMLVGYFVLFILLLIVAMVASIAGSAAGRGQTRSRSRIGGFGSFYLTTRLIQFFIALWLYTGRGGTGRRKTGRGRPLHHSVFAFVFGDESPNRNWNETVRKDAIAFVRVHNGLITVDELMEITGMDYAASERFMNELLREYNGKPEVTPEGTLYFQFSELMYTTDNRSEPGPVGSARKRLIPFNNNQSKTNRWIGFFNGFNILLGSYFLYFSLAEFNPAAPISRFFVIVYRLIAEIANPQFILMIGLGAVPVVFSLVFFIVPWVRRMIEKRKNERIKEENFRRKIYAFIMDSPKRSVPDHIKPYGADESPGNWARIRERTMDTYAAVKDADIQTEDGNRLVYMFDELDREHRDLARFRQTVDVEQYKVGDIVFDSGKDETKQ